MHIAVDTLLNIYTYFQEAFYKTILWQYQPFNYPITQFLLYYRMAQLWKFTHFKVLSFLQIEPFLKNSHFSGFLQELRKLIQ